VRESYTLIPWLQKREVAPPETTMELFELEKFPNKPILKTRKSLSINNKYQKKNLRIAKSKPRQPDHTNDNVADVAFRVAEM
jgi:hypothetical protein